MPKFSLFFLLLYATKINSQCPPGQYIENSSCKTCPLGFDCSSGSAIKCSSGTYSFLGIECRSCEPGYFCPDPTQASQIICPDGTYSNAAAVSCTVCEEGSFCVDGEKSSCPANTFAPSKGATSCILCPAGFSCSGTADSVTIQYCSTGTWSKLGDTTCTACENNQYCNVNSLKNSLSCPENYVNTNQAECSPCPQNTDRTSSDLTCQTCPNGQFSFPGFPCQECPNGFSCLSVSDTPTLPKLCDPGQYIDESQNSKCVDCTAGTYCTIFSTSPTQCPRGTYSRNKAFRCSLCADGYLCENGSETSCTNENQFCTGGESFICPKGSYKTAGTTGTSVASCDLCLAHSGGFGQKC